MCSLSLYFLFLEDEVKWGLETYDDMVCSKNVQNAQRNLLSKVREESGYYTNSITVEFEHLFRFFFFSFLT